MIKNRKLKISQIQKQHFCEAHLETQNFKNPKNSPYCEAEKEVREKFNKSQKRFEGVAFRRFVSHSIRC